MLSSEYLPTYLISHIIIWFVIGNLNCTKISLVSRLIDRTIGFCIFSITHVVVTVYSPNLIPYVLFEIKILRVIRIMSTLL